MGQLQQQQTEDSDDDVSQGETLKKITKICKAKGVKRNGNWSWYHKLRCVDRRTGSAALSTKLSASPTARRMRRMRMLGVNSSIKKTCHTLSDWRLWLHLPQGHCFEIERPIIVNEGSWLLGLCVCMCVCVGVLLPL